MRFVSKMYRAFWETEGTYERRDLRHKVLTDPAKSDRELFDSLPMADIWADTNLPRTYSYARASKHLVIPSSWQTTIARFDADLRAMVSRLN